MFRKLGYFFYGINFRNGSKIEDQLASFQLCFILMVLLPCDL